MESSLEALRSRIRVPEGKSFLIGLSGGADSAAKRKQILKHLSLPEYMSANAMLHALNLLYTKEELTSIVDSILE